MFSEEEIFQRLESAFLSTSMGKVFAVFKANNIDVELFIDDGPCPDVDTLENGRFVYITITDFYKLFKNNVVNISYGIGYELDWDESYITQVNELKKLEKFIIQTCEYYDYLFLESSLTDIDIGMLGNKISLKSNFNFKSLFLDSEVKIFEEFLKNYFK